MMLVSKNSGTELRTEAKNSENFNYVHYTVHLKTLSELLLLCL